MTMTVHLFISTYFFSIFADENASLFDDTRVMGRGRLGLM